MSLVSRRGYLSPLVLFFVFTVTSCTIPLSYITEPSTLEFLQGQGVSKDKLVAIARSRGFSLSLVVTDAEGASRALTLAKEMGRPLVVSPFFGSYDPSAVVFPPRLSEGSYLLSEDLKPGLVDTLRAWRLEHGGSSARLIGPGSLPPRFIETTLEAYLLEAGIPTSVEYLIGDGDESIGKISTWAATNDVIISTQPLTSSKIIAEILSNNLGYISWGSSFDGLGKKQLGILAIDYKKYLINLLDTIRDAKKSDFPLPQLTFLHYDSTRSVW